MQIVYNGLTSKESPCNYTCNHCDSIISVSDGEMFTGYLGDKYFKCPVCGKHIMAKSPEDYQKAKDVVYPFSFYNYIKDCTPTSCTDAEVNELIQDVFKDGCDTVKINIAHYKDTMVLAIENGVDDKGKPLYNLFVCRGVDETTCTKD